MGEIVADSESGQANARVVERFFEAVLSGDRDAGAVERYLAEEFVDHDASASDAGVSGVVAKLEALWEAMPRGHYRIVQGVAAGELVMVRSLLEGGEIPVEFADTYRVRDGRIVE